LTPQHSQSFLSRHPLNDLRKNERTTGVCTIHLTLLVDYTNVHRIASPISPPYWCSKSHRYELRIDFQHEEYIISWASANRRPDLLHFPILDVQFSSEKIKHSREESKVWAESRVHCFGSFGQVRELIPPDARFPMMKLAHKSQIPPRLIDNEFSTITDLSLYDLPIVQIDAFPLKDEDGIFGFRMEKLFKIKAKDFPQHSRAITEAVHRIHKKGKVHTDLSISNIMLDNARNIRVIDFGHAGNIDKPLPADHPCRVYRGWETFDTQIDILALEKMLAFL
jgi:hypothetical protein